MSQRAQLVLVGLLALGAAAALIDALRRRQELAIDIVQMQVDGLRNTALVMEDKLGQAPSACGDEVTARAVLETSPPEQKGECGERYYGRGADAPGPYWVELDALGGFTVHGLARVRGETWHITATRDAEATRRLETP